MTGWKDRILVNSWRCQTCYLHLPIDVITCPQCGNSYRDMCICCTKFTLLNNVPYKEFYLVPASGSFLTTLDGEIYRG